MTDTTDEIWACAPPARFDTHRDDLEQHRLNNVYLGRVMFWRNTDQLPTKHIYHTDNVEYPVEYSRQERGPNRVFLAFNAAFQIVSYGIRHFFDTFCTKNSV